MFGVLGLLVVPGMLVHMGEWFGLTLIAALHPVNALILTYASLTLAKRSNAYWTAEDRCRRPSHAKRASKEAQTFAT